MVTYHSAFLRCVVFQNVPMLNPILRLHAHLICPGKKQDTMYIRDRSAGTLKTKLDKQNSDKNFQKILACFLFIEWKIPSKRKVKNLCKKDKHIFNLTQSLNLIKINFKRHLTHLYLFLPHFITILRMSYKWKRWSLKWVLYMSIINVKIQNAVN